MLFRMLVVVGALAAGGPALGQASLESGRPEALLPENTLFYAGCDDLSAMLAKWKSSPSGQILHEKEVQEFLQKPMQMLHATIEHGIAIAKQQPALAQVDLDVDKLLAGPYGRAFVAITQLEPPAPGVKINGQTLELGIVVGIEPKAGAADPIGLMKQVVATALEAETSGASKLETVHADDVTFERIAPKEEDAPSLVFANVAGINVMSLSPRAVTGMLKLAKGGGKSLLSSPDYARCVAAVGAPANGDLVVYTHAGRFLTSVVNVLHSVLEQSGKKQELEMVQKIFDASKIGSFGPFYACSSWRNGAAWNAHYTEVDPSAGGLCGLARAAPIDLELLKLVPKEATGFSLSSFDLAPIYDTVMDALKNVHPEVHAMVQQKMREFEASVAGADDQGAPNWDIRRDLIGAIGGRLMLVDLPSSGSGMMGLGGEFSLWIESPHPEALEKSLGYLFALIGQTTGQPFKFKDQVYGDVTLHVLDNMSLGMAGAMTGGKQFTYALHNGRFYFATTTKGLKKMLDSEKTPPKENITARKDFADRFVPPTAKNAVVTSLHYSDTASDVEQGYNTLVSMIPMLTMAMPVKLESLPIEVSLLPTGETLSQHLFGTVGISYTVGNIGHLSESRGPFGLEVAAGALVAVATIGVIAGNEAESRRTAADSGAHKAGAAKSAAKKPAIQAAKEQLDDFNRAITIYMIEFGKPPASLEELTQPKPSYPNGFLESKQLPKDPWGNAYHYSSDGKEKYTLWSSGPDGVDQNGAPGSDDIVQKGG